jgi:hypothetical protein
VALTLARDGGCPAGWKRLPRRRIAPRGGIPSAPCHCGHGPRGVGPIRAPTWRAEARSPGVGVRDRDPRAQVRVAVGVGADLGFKDGSGGRNVGGLDDRHQPKAGRPRWAARPPGSGRPWQGPGYRRPRNRHRRPAPCAPEARGTRHLYRHRLYGGVSGDQSHRPPIHTPDRPADRPHSPCRAERRAPRAAAGPPPTRRPRVGPQPRAAWQAAP